MDKLNSVGMISKRVHVPTDVHPVLTVVIVNRQLFDYSTFVTDTVSNPLEELVPTESLYAEVFVQTEDVDKSLSNQNMKDEGGMIV